jgi:hypothetical protein
MLKEVVYQAGAYAETVELESGNTRLVDCGGGGYTPLYRLEWEEDGYYHHSVFYDWPAAEANFLRRSGQSV